VRLAVAADMNPATLNRIEQGKANPNIRTLERLAEALGISLVELLADDSPKAQASLWPERSERREDVYEYTDEQRITQGFLRAHGIEANDSEILVLNQYIQLHERPPAELGIIVHVVEKGEPVDHERVRGILLYLLAKNLLDKEEVEAVSRKVYAGLVSTA
jgi:transcriptional regulator with XRE-family HTH domain